MPPANFGVKPSRPGAGPAAELPTSSPAYGVTPLRLRHGEPAAQLTPRTLAGPGRLSKTRPGREMCSAITPIHEEPFVEDFLRHLDFSFAVTILAAIFTIVGTFASAIGKASQARDLVNWLRGGKLPLTASTKPPTQTSAVDGVAERLAEAKEVLRQQYTLARAHRIGGGSLTFGQFIVGGLLASSFVQDHTTKTLIGLLGLLVLASSIIRQHYKPESSSVAARERAVTLKAVIREVEDHLYFREQGLNEAASPRELRSILTNALNELDITEAQALAKSAAPVVGRSSKSSEAGKAGA
jgi:hypothetical protein